MKVPALKFLLLRLLKEGPLSGYELMKRVESITGVSHPGSIYPLLRWWEERGFIEKDEKYHLTDKGKKFLDELEERRKEYLEMAKRDLLALARALDDPEMEKLASLIPFRESIGEEAVILMSSLGELLSRCKKKELLRDIREVLQRWEGC